MIAEIDIILRLLLAVVLGGVIGFQREKAGKQAGLRTITLICVGAALFAIVSAHAFETDDTARIASGVVAGIGFLGAGTIIRGGEGMVAGLTTAATIWAVAGIGLAVGAGMYITAPVATVIILLILILPHFGK